LIQLGEEAGGVEEVVAMGSGVGREVSSVFQAWEEFVVWEREDYLTLQSTFIRGQY